MATPKQLIIASVALALGGGVVAGPASAHHSYAMFDQAQTLNIDGAVVKWSWTNPHAFLEVVADGKHWELESASPSILTRAGMNRNILKPGDKVSVTMHPRRDKSAGGYLLTVALPGGKTMSLDSARQQQP